MPAHAAALLKLGHGPRVPAGDRRRTRGGTQKKRLGRGRENRRLKMLLGLAGGAGSAAPRRPRCAGRPDPPTDSTDSCEQTCSPRKDPRRCPPTQTPRPPPRFRVLIPTHGRPDLLIRTLESLAGCELPGNYAETVVAENGSDAGARDACAAADPRLNVRYVQFAEGNKSAALNAVLAGVPEGPVLFLDDDVRLAPGALAAYAAAAQKHGPGSWFAGPLDIDYEHEPKRWVKPFLPRSAAGWEWDGGEGDPGVIDRMEAMGANWCAFAEDLHAARPIRRPTSAPAPPPGRPGRRRDMMTPPARTSGETRPLRAGGSRLVHHYVPAGVGSAPKWLTNRAYRNRPRTLGLRTAREHVWRVPGLHGPAVVADAGQALFEVRNKFRREAGPRKARRCGCGWS